MTHYVKDWCNKVAMSRLNKREGSLIRSSSSYIGMDFYNTERAILRLLSFY